jgi:succinate dehydrogenase flavin-adding protein (antitoxin of CptAB toxin-antitoxin module)
VQRETRFTADQILEMDDDQLLFWYSGGKTAVKQDAAAAVSVKLDARKSWAENMAEIARRKAEWEAANSG